MERNGKEDEKLVRGDGRGTEEGKEKKGGWWNEDCKEKKKEVRHELRKWRENSRGKEKFREKKQEYKKLCRAEKERGNGEMRERGGTGQEGE